MKFLLSCNDANETGSDRQYVEQAFHLAQTITTFRFALTIGAREEGKVLAQLDVLLFQKQR
ncbi:hypothetical protein D3C72_2557090 [compost metagenome]